MSDRENSTMKAEGFDEADGFRETFLHHFTDPKDREALLRLSSMLYDYWYSQARHMPKDSESFTRGDLRSAVRDLRHVECFLRNVVGNAPEVYEVSERDAELASLALLTAGSLSEIAEVIEVELDRPHLPL